MKFTKMHGAGNDYVYIDCMRVAEVESMDRAQKSKLAKAISRRHYGVGSDGLILIRRGEKSEFKMEMYNSDGSLSEMCGNGIRCVVKYLHDEKYVNGDLIEVETGAGVLSSVVTDKDDEGKARLIKVDMGEPVLDARLIPVLVGEKGNYKTLDTMTNLVDEMFAIDDRIFRFTSVSMGNPHCVIFVDNLKSLKNLDLKRYGSKIEHIDLFPNRTNVEFVFAKNDHTLYQRTWERGAGETLACGTGACASVVAGVLTGKLDRCKDISNHLKGGVLNIHWNPTDDHVFLEGDAVRVFDGDFLF